MKGADLISAFCFVVLLIIDIRFRLIRFLGLFLLILLVLLVFLVFLLTCLTVILQVQITTLQPTLRLTLAVLRYQ